MAAAPPALATALVLAALCGSAAACDPGAGRDAVVVAPAAVAGDPAAPEPASGWRAGLRPVQARSYMVVSAHPLASQAGCDVLRAGGSAVDAAVAVQAVLGLVEPQSSGLGGGAFLMHYDAQAKAVAAYDGRETAPAAATPDHLRWIDDATDQGAPLPSARASGRSIGTPGVVRMLALAHREHGKLPWRDLWQPGIRLATDGFAIGGRLAAAITDARGPFLRDAEAAATYLDAEGVARGAGTVLTVPAYARTLATLADHGADAFYSGPLAQAIVDKINAGAVDGTPITPGKTTLADLAAYEAKQREPVCTTYRVHVVCGMPPPSSGGLAVAQVLGILENFGLAPHAPAALDREGGKPAAMAVHLVSEAERLAYADRDAYVADTDFVPLPGGSTARMLDKDYLRRRAELIDFSASLGTAPPGDLGPATFGADRTVEHGTTHFTIVDRDGDVVSMTSSVESSFGSFHMTQGFMLNNQLTDFSAAPVDPLGRTIANRVAAGKRPRSSMAPTLVFRVAADGTRGDFAMATGSPGGSTIIQHVVKTLVAVLDWGLDAQQAAAMVDFGAANSPTTHVGGEHPNIAAGDDPLVAGLRALGHAVSTSAQVSGIATIVRNSVGGVPVLEGGADPRREGLALGDTFGP